jgi:hypothetical protein
VFSSGNEVVELERGCSRVDACSYWPAGACTVFTIAYTIRIRRRERKAHARARPNLDGAKRM